ncbi:adenylate/guanylate cyclase domain-containing protein [Leptothoe spongobia TAU-MAC 1115]|uniref:Adenylate cyclase n=1 Tax=Leptothoe spongobia TAU-MAC 1115 TaxID=1967444 RepID=A0A947DDW6_9CYAN|nr:adenylate/guanylate cyclase domain-containing protein [Leptothoe spongobia]MBT9314564.1 adenylate/guanylate cyclase domain-containing protein [Leptothoe spongobia TAU-MAC 1115]
MKNLPENTSRRLTVLYISSLSAIATLAIMGQFRVQRLLNEQKLDIQVITAAQRQQLVSQQLVKSTLTIRLPMADDAKQEHAEHLQEVIQSAESWRQKLIALQTATHLSQQQQQQVQTMTTDLAHQYEMLVETATAALADISTGNTRIQSPRQNLQDVTQLLRTEKAFINDMDRLILAYNQQVDLEANRLKRLEHGLFLVTITVLILEGCLVFRPATRKIRHTLNSLKQALQETQETAAQLAIEQQKSEKLLLNILPQPIAQRLKQEPQAIADGFSSVTVLFADIVGFTQLSTQISPEKLVALLNSIFSAFDQLVEKHGLEKIKTIGDAYMAVGGLPLPCADHAQAVVKFALDMQTVIDKFNWETGHNLSIRIGINSGPVVAGVIGIKKYIYDLWGDTVNTASRMESHGTPGTIQITESTFQLIQNQFRIEPIGQITVKGKGNMMTYRVISSLAV